MSSGCRLAAPLCPASGRAPPGVANDAVRSAVNSLQNGAGWGARAGAGGAATLATHIVMRFAILRGHHERVAGARIERASPGGYPGVGATPTTPLNGSLSSRRLQEPLAKGGGRHRCVARAHREKARGAPGFCAVFYRKTKSRSLSPPFQCCAKDNLVAPPVKLDVRETAPRHQCRRGSTRSRWRVSG